jgi:hypothetical protein
MNKLLLILGSTILLIVGISCFLVHAIGGCIGISIKVFFETILYPLGSRRKTHTGSWH